MPNQQLSTSKASVELPIDATSEPPLNLQQGRRYAAPPVNSTRVVQKPISRAQVEDPREFQVQQLRRRFSPKEENHENDTVFSFQMVPSDPDFPFEMVGLQCVLHVPFTYPQNGRPSLHVKNKEMGRGYQINVERGFEALTEKSPQYTLLGLMTALDKQLESLLSAEKASTIKITPNVAIGRQVRQANIGNDAPSVSKFPPATTINDWPTAPIHTPEQKRTAQARREMETHQLEARLGRLPLFSKSSDSIAYTVPVDPRRHEDLPIPLQVIKTVKLFVPLLYPLHHCRIEILGVTREAASNTEMAFECRAKDKPETTLMGQINYLAQHMHILAAIPATETLIEPPDVQPVASLGLGGSTDTSKAFNAPEEFNDRSHIKIIPRPPEWAIPGEDDDADDSGYTDSSGSDNDDLTDEAGEEAPDSSLETTSGGPERGILLSFPLLELYGIELLELVALCLTIKCERCKDTMDISNLRNHGNVGASGIRSASCKKCANTLSIGVYAFEFIVSMADLPEQGIEGS